MSSLVQSLDQLFDSCSKSTVEGYNCMYNKDISVTTMGNK